MPNPILYLQAMGAAFLVSALVFVAGGWRRPAGKNAVGMGLGLAIGYSLLKLWSPWPPTSALARMVWLIMPSICVIELLAATPRVPLWLGWALRILLAGATARILLHSSIYLDPSRGEWTAAQAVSTLAVCAILLAGIWAMLWCLSRRSIGASLPLSLSATVLTAGVMIILAGYVSGGEAAWPLGAVLAGFAVASLCLDPRSTSPGAVSIGVVGLFSLLIIGRYFGGLSTPGALAMFLTPLLCWLPELPPLSRAKFWQRELLRLGIVAIPLVITLVLAKQAFDRDAASPYGSY